MDELKLLALCAACAEEAGLEFSIARKGEDNAPFDMLYLPAFQQTPDENGTVMEMAVYCLQSKYALMEQMQYRLLHMMGYIAHVTHPATLRELRVLLGEINFQLPIGAFDVDADGTVFMRYTLPVPEEMSEELFLRQFATALAVMNSFALVFMAPIFSVIHGECTAKSAMELTESQLDALMDKFKENGVMQ